MRDLKWFDPGEGSDQDTISVLENRLSVRFPADFVEFLLRHAGGASPEIGAFDVEDDDGRVRSYEVGGVLRPDAPVRDLEAEQLAAWIDDEELDRKRRAMARSGSYILETMENLGVDNQLPAGVIPIIENGGGDYVCLDFRNAAEPVVVFWFHELTDDKHIAFLAESFTAFLEQLAPVQDLDD